MTERQERIRQILAQLWSMYRYRIEHMAVLVEVTNAIERGSVNALD